jgi:hypothetical protein
METGVPVMTGLATLIPLAEAQPIKFNSTSNSEKI